jgi:hypothetical protein
MDFSDKWRFWSRIERSERGCWEWTGSCSVSGHGQMHCNTAGGRTIGVHRFAFILLVGPIPRGLHVLHSCDNAKCCNPTHLRVGTRRENMRDMLDRGRHCNAQTGPLSRRMSDPT